MSHSRRPLQLDEARIRRMHADGYTFNKMAPLLGCCPNDVRRVLVRLGLRIRPYRPHVDPDRLRELHGQGWSVARMAADQGVGYSTRFRRLRALGLSPTGYNSKVYPGTEIDSV